MKLMRALSAGSCALVLVAAAAQDARAARRGDRMLQAELSGTTSGDASGIARLKREAGRTVFSLKVRGLAPGEYGVLVDGSLEGFLFVETAGPAEVRFDSRALDDETTVLRDDGPETLGLAFDPRGRSIQVAREGRVLLETVFPSGPAKELRRDH